MRLRLEAVGVQGGGRWYRGPDRALADAWLAAALEAEHRGRSLWWPSITVGLERRW
ncbi:MAG: hypothetical protein KatS3mg121_0777 [Gammaproteobacteria bacterium]|nr:MAG: hypothetical protein KatS3mg121_0777 [Gammaproteobacteria bacterium]